MKRAFSMIIIFIVLCAFIFAIANASDYAMMQQQQQQQQQNQEDYGGSFTEIVTSVDYGNQVVPAGYGGSGGGNSLGTPGSNAPGDYATQKPADFGQLTDTGTTSGFNDQVSSGAPAGPNGLWIVDSAGVNRYPSMSLPINGYASEEITPSMEGYLTVEELYPNGQVRTFSMGYVKPYHVYKMWFTADVPGTHKVRYTINGYHSNTIEFYVQGGASQGSANPEANTSSVVIGSRNAMIGRDESTTSESNTKEPSDPVEAFCIERGNLYHDGICTYPGGSSCNALAFSRGDCILTGKPNTGGIQIKSIQIG